MLTKIWLFAAIAAFTIPSASAQVAQAAQSSPPANPAWQRVEVLPPGTRIYIGAKLQTTCNFTRADAESLTCAEGAGGNPLTIQRIDIRVVKRARRTRSTWAGFGIGYVAGAAIGSATSSGSLGKVAGGGAGAVLGIITGSIIGHFTDFTRSTIYKAP